MLFVFSGLFSLAASLPLKCTTTSFPTDLTGKSCDGLQPAGPAAPRRRVRRHLLRAGRGGLLDVEFQARGRRLPGAVLHRHGHALRRDDLAQVRRRPARRAGDPAARAVPVERRQVLLDGRERAVEVRLHLPARRRCRRHVRQSPGPAPPLRRLGRRRRLEGQHRLQRHDVVHLGLARRPRVRARRLALRGEQRRRLGRQDGDRRGRQRRAAPRARPGLALRQAALPAGARPSRRRGRRTRTPTIRRCWPLVLPHERAGPAGPALRRRLHRPQGEGVRAGRQAPLRQRLECQRDRVHAVGHAGRRRHQLGGGDADRRLAGVRGGAQRRGSTRWAAPTTRRCAPCAPYPPSTAAAGAPSRRRRSRHRRRLRGARRRAVRVGAIVRRRRAQGRRVHVRRHGVDRRDGDDADADDGERHAHRAARAVAAVVRGDRLAVVPVLLEHGSG